MTERGGFLLQKKDDDNEEYDDYDDDDDDDDDDEERNDRKGAVSYCNNLTTSANSGQLCVDPWHKIGPLFR